MKLGFTWETLPSKFTVKGSLFLKQKPGKTPFGKASDKVNKKFTRYWQIFNGQYTNTVLVVTKDNKKQLRLKPRLMSYLQSIKAM